MLGLYKRQSRAEARGREQEDEQRGDNWSRTHRKTQETGEQRGWTKNRTNRRKGTEQNAGKRTLETGDELD
jgi:hypothetical protein